MTTPLLGLRVFVVEDETLISMMLVDMLEDLGCCVVAAAGSVQEAVDCLEGLLVDVAVLDINLGGESSEAVADALSRRGTPFLFATAYDLQRLDRKWSRVPRLLKPFGEGQLADGLRLAIGTPFRPAAGLA